MAVRNSGYARRARARLSDAPRPGFHCERCGASVGRPRKSLPPKLCMTCRDAERKERKFDNTLRRRFTERWWRKVATVRARDKQL